jgi:anti-sigma factor (TIGR02949 family)
MKMMYLGSNTCEYTLRYLDAYIDNELLTETCQQIAAHLASCPACARELEVRRSLKSRIKTVSSSETVSPELQMRIRRSLRATTPVIRKSRFASMRMLAVAAMLTICVGGVIAYQLGRLRFTINSQETYIARISASVGALFQVGLGDHVHCTVFRKLPKNPPATETLISKMGPEYAPLIQIVRDQIPADLKMVLAHQCSYHKRKFVHLAMQNDRGLVSLVITNKRDGEFFDPKQLPSLIAQSGVPIYRSAVQRFQIAAFETADHLAYIVSDLPERENLQLANSLAAPVKNFLATKKS